MLRTSVAWAMAARGRGANITALRQFWASGYFAFLEIIEVFKKCFLKKYSIFIIAIVEAKIGYLKHLLSDLNDTHILIPR